MPVSARKWQKRCEWVLLRCYFVYQGYFKSWSRISTSLWMPTPLSCQKQHFLLILYSSSIVILQHFIRKGLREDMRSIFVIRASNYPISELCEKIAYANRSDAKSPSIFCCLAALCYPRRQCRLSFPLYRKISSKTKICTYIWNQQLDIFQKICLLLSLALSQRFYRFRRNRVLRRKLLLSF